MSTIQITEMVRIAESRHWIYCVGRVGDRWLGFAIGKDARPGDPKYMHVFAEVAVGYDLGVPDRKDAVRRTAALAVDPERGFDRPGVWWIEESLRANPADFACRHCGEPFCEGNECRE